MAGPQDAVSKTVQTGSKPKLLVFIDDSDYLLQMRVIVTPMVFVVHQN